MNNWTEAGDKSDVLPTGPYRFIIICELICIRFLCSYLSDDRHLRTLIMKTRRVYEISRGFQLTFAIQKWQNENIGDNKSCDIRKREYRMRMTLKKIEPANCKNVFLVKFWSVVLKKIMFINIAVKVLNIGDKVYLLKEHSVDCVNNTCLLLVFFLCDHQT